MDQRSDDIRHDIESTRASLDDKLNQLEHRAKETFDLKHQVQEHPFMMLGAAVLTGYVLGSLGGGDNHRQPAYSSGLGQTDGSSQRQHDGGGFMSQFDDEIQMLKTAAIATVGGMFRDIVKEVAPAIGQQMDRMKSERRSLPESGISSHSPTAANGPGQAREPMPAARVEPMRAHVYADPMARDDHH